MKELYEARGTSRWEREAKEDKGINTVEEWMKKYKEKQLEERKNKIEKSVLAKEYKRWKGVGRAKYLGQKGKGKRLKTLARFRCCNKWRGNKYWEEDSKRECRLCGEKEETWNHILTECIETKEMSIPEAAIMSEGGEGVEWMLKIIRKRSERELQRGRGKDK